MCNFNMNNTATQQIHTIVIRLDGEAWSLAIDPTNEGCERQWYLGLPASAGRTRIPGVMQWHFSEYHGVAWYYREFVAPANPHIGGRYLLRFHAVDYLAEVWVNGQRIGQHEGAEEPFMLDATDAVKPGEVNTLAVRVLNPTDEAIDGIRMLEVPVGRRENGMPSDNAYNTGGITDSVELAVVPVVRIADVHVLPDWQTGVLRVRTQLHNAEATPVRAHLQLTVAPAVNGATLAVEGSVIELAAGDNWVEMQIQVPSHRLWELNDPYLYRVTAGVQVADDPSIDEMSVRCGFRDFRFERGYFRLNGRRIRLHGALYTVLQYPVSMSVPYAEDLLRRDVLNLKMMGFNSVRITCGAALPARQLDLFDEMGLLVCEEHFGADANGHNRMLETPQLETRWDASISGVIRRDRNHPCIVMWSLLNEVSDGRIFRHVVAALESIRDLDDSRIVLLNSGRFDQDCSIGSWSSPHSRVWEHADLQDVHAYPNFPHSSDSIRAMRGRGEMALYKSALVESDQRPMLLSEYGVCGAEDYPRYLRHFEQLGQETAGDAREYRTKYEWFMTAWRQWRLEECWARPEDYFRDSQRNMSALVLSDFNAWTANPRLVGAFSSTQIIDAWFHGCGVTTYFRESKPGMADVYADMGAQLRWCVFVEPVHVYRGARVTVEAVLCNLDALPPGDYPVRVQVINPHLQRAFDEQITVTIPEVTLSQETPFAQLVFSREMLIDGPAGRYRAVVEFTHGAAAAGETAFNVGDIAEMPEVVPEIVLWGDDAELADWLTSRGLAWRPYAPGHIAGRQVILACGSPPAPGGTAVFDELASRITAGANVIFLTASTLVDGECTTGRYPYPMCWAPFPLAERPSLAWASSWYFRADHWAKVHPIFAGLPSGGVMDYQFYRDVIDGNTIANLPSVDEAVCGTLYTSGAGFSADPIITIHRLCAGSFLLNTLRIREHLGSVPPAEHLLRNMLNYMATATTESERVLLKGIADERATPWNMV